MSLLLGEVPIDTKKTHGGRYFCCDTKTWTEKIHGTCPSYSGTMTMWYEYIFFFWNHLSPTEPRHVWVHAIFLWICFRSIGGCISPWIVAILSMFEPSCTQMLHVWCIYLHLPMKSSKCRYVRIYSLHGSCGVGYTIHIFANFLRYSHGQVWTCGSCTPGRADFFLGGERW